MSCGSFAGPDSPNQVAATRSSPNSLNVGMSGKFGIRFSVVTASASTLPERICSAADENVIVPNLTWPAMRSAIAGPAPL